MSVTAETTPRENPGRDESGDSSVSQPPCRHRSGGAARRVAVMMRREAVGLLALPTTAVLLAGASFFLAFVFIANFVELRNSDPRTVFENFGVVMLLIAPVLTMRAFSDEKQRGTLEHLLATPARNWEIVAGKFTGATATAALLLATTAVPVGVTAVYSSVDWGALVARYVGAVLLLLAVISLGIACSSLARNHFVSALASLLLLLGLQYAGLANTSTGGWVAHLASYIGLTTHEDGFFQGTILWRDVVYFLSLSGAALTVALWGLSSARRSGWSQ